VIIGAGLGLCMQVLSLATQNAVEFKDVAVATSAITFFRTIGGVIGVTVCQTVLQNQLNAALPGFSNSNQGGGLSDIRLLPPLIKSKVINAYADSLDMVFISLVPLCGLGAIAGVFLKHIELRKSLADPKG